MYIFYCNIFLCQQKAYIYGVTFSCMNIIFVVRVIYRVMNKDGTQNNL